VLINAARDYYPFEIVPDFWSWLVHVSSNGNVKIPREIYDEIQNGNDELSKWVKEHREVLVLDEEVDTNLLRHVLDKGYAPQLTEVELGQIGRDPFLVAYALAVGDERCVVTAEVSKPSKTRANRRIPDVCEAVHVRSINSFQFIRELRFNTRWNR